MDGVIVCQEAFEYMIVFVKFLPGVEPCWTPDIIPLE